MARLKRILFISKTRMKNLNILKSMFYSLEEMNYYVREIDLTQYPSTICKNPQKLRGGYGPIEIDYLKVRDEIELFKPDMIMIVAGGLTFSKDISTMLRNKGIIIVGVTLSDPDIFENVVNYADRFDYHTTNSLQAFNMYKEKGIKNTLYMPFGIDSRFFVPYTKQNEPQNDVIIISHFRKERLEIVEKMKKEFNVKIYGANWPYEGVVPIAYPQWVKEVRNSKFILDFPITGEGYYNVKVRLFEAAATGTPIITKKIDEIGNFFEFDKEILGYDTLEDAINIIKYYKMRDKKRIEIGENAKIRCAKEHLWVNRLEQLFYIIGFK